MVKLECGGAGVIATVLAPASSNFDQALLTLYPPPSLTAVRRLAPPLSSIGIGPGSRPERLLRRVVSSERRTHETELASIEGPQFSVNDLLCRELAAALLTNQGSRRARSVETGTTPRPEWQTPEALPSPVQMATLAVDDRVVAES